MNHHVPHLDFSPRKQDSITRAMSANFTKQYSEKYPDASVTYQDYHLNPISIIDQGWIDAYHKGIKTPDNQRTVDETEAILGEFLDADTLVCGILSKISMRPRRFLITSTVSSSREEPLDTVLMVFRLEWSTRTNESSSWREAAPRITY